MEAARTNQIFEDIVETIREPLLVLNQGLSVVTANRSFYECFKVKPEETVGRFIFDLGNKQWNIPKLRVLLETILPQKTTFDDYEVEHDFATIGRRTMLLNARQIQRVLGKERIILLAIEDITERKRLENLLADSEERYRRLFETADDGIVLLEKGEGKITHANPATEKMLGYTREESIGNKLQDIGISLDLGDFQTTMENLNKNGMIKYDDVPVKTKAGRHIDTDIYLVDRARLVQCNIRDITERKQAEEALKEANRKLEASQTAALNTLEDLKAENQVRKAKEAELERVMMAIEQAGEVIMITDPAGMIQYLNPAFETVTGYGREEAVGKTPGILKSGRQDQTFYQNLWETITSGRIWQGRMVNQRKDGTLYTEDGTISPVFDAAGKIINYVGVKRDVTAHLELTAQLQQAQKMESVGRLAGGVAHDFNNKLTVMMGYTQLVMRGLDRGDPIAANLQEVMNAGQQSVAIVRQLLAFARKQIISPRVLNLNETMEDMLKMMRRLIGEDIDLVWSPGHDLWQVKMDPSQLDQILANLCVNARDAIEGAGKVTIETENRVLDRSYLDDHPGFIPGEYVMLAVTDSGCGMDRETLANAFEPFFTTKEVGKGTGLGLSTVYGIVKQNHGFVNIYSEPGKGTGFKIYLPRHLGEAEEGIEAAQTEASRGRGETILVVEDDESLLGLTQMILAQAGYHALTTASSIEAMEMVRQQEGKIDLLLADVVMPEMSGVELANEIKKIRPNIKTLFMSGYARTAELNHETREKAVPFLLEKPFTPDSLTVKVREALGS